MRIENNGYNDVQIILDRAYAIDEDTDPGIEDGTGEEIEKLYGIIGAAGSAVVYIPNSELLFLATASPLMRDSVLYGYRFRGVCSDGDAASFLTIDITNQNGTLTGECSVKAI